MDWLERGGGVRWLVVGGAVTDLRSWSHHKRYPAPLTAGVSGVGSARGRLEKGDSMGMRSVERSSRGGPRRRLVPRKAATLAAAGLALLLATAVALAATGDITQPAGTAGCVSQAGVESCADGHALNDANGVAVSPDGKNVYVASYGSEAVGRPHPRTTPRGVTPTTRASRRGADPNARGFSGHAPRGATAVAVAREGKNASAASFFCIAVRRPPRTPPSAVTTDPAGTAGCVSEDGSGPCADGHALIDPNSVAVSPDGKSVYVASSFGS